MDDYGDNVTVLAEAKSNRASTIPQLDKDISQLDDLSFDEQAEGLVCIATRLEQTSRSIVEESDDVLSRVAAKITEGFSDKDRENDLMRYGDLQFGLEAITISERPDGTAVHELALVYKAGGEHRDKITFPVKESYFLGEVTWYEKTALPLNAQRNPLATKTESDNTTYAELSEIGVVWRNLGRMIEKFEKEKVSNREVSLSIDLNYFKGLSVSRRLQKRLQKTEELSFGFSDNLMIYHSPCKERCPFQKDMFLKKYN